MLTKVLTVGGVLKSGSTSQGGKWEIMKVTLENGEQATGYNLKAGDEVFLRFSKQYNNYSAIKLSNWQAALFELVLDLASVLPDEVQNPDETKAQNPDEPADEDTPPDEKISDLDVNDFL